MLRVGQASRLCMLLDACPGHWLLSALRVRDASNSAVVLYETSFARCAGVEPEHRLCDMRTGSEARRELQQHASDSHHLLNKGFSLDNITSCLRYARYSSSP
jgi:hypothetical protein